MQFKIESRELLEIMESAKTMSHADGLMKLKQDKWDMKVEDGSNAGMFAVRVPREAMSEYTRGDVDMVGIEFDWFTDYLRKDSKEVSVSFDYESHKLQLSRGNSGVVHPPVDEDYVDGKGRTPPQLNYAVKAHNIHSEIINFAQQAEKITDSDNIYLCCSEDGIFMYSERDSSEYYEHISWDDIDSKSVDWNTGASGDRTRFDPAEKKMTEVILDVNFIKEIRDVCENSVFFLDNHRPIKCVFSRESGIKLSWIIAPRIVSDHGQFSMPEKIIKRISNK